MSHLYRRGRTYWLCYWMAGGERRRFSLRTEDLVEAKRTRQQIDDLIARGLDPEQQAGYSLAQLEADYRTYYLGPGADLEESRRRAWASDRAALRKVLDYFRARAIERPEQVQREHVVGFRDDALAAGAKPGTVAKSMRVAQAAWGWAVEAGRLEQNPWPGIKKPKAPKFSKRRLTADVCLLILESDARLEEPVWLLVAIAIYAGLRNSELCRLRWEDLDLDGRRLTVPVTAGTARAKARITKSRRPRVVRIVDELYQILEPRQQTGGLVVPSRPAGGPYRNSALCGAVKRLSALIGIEFTLHDLRRSLARIASDRGVPTEQIRRLLGHSTIATTEGYIGAADEVTDVEGVERALKLGRQKPKVRRSRGA